ncbi:MAG TPA: glutamate--cysteine ligase [Nitrosospira sp.]|nr:glutamate--cysteine ligase [Nitrosospira sp.]
MPVPLLATASFGQTPDLERCIVDAMPSIEHWLRNQWQAHEVPFYCSVDLRNSGFKLAPVDTNLFPAGFNNLNPEFMPLCVQAMMAAVEKICADAKNVLLIPESHTRNIFYFQNIATLQAIMGHAGLDVRIGSLLPEISTATTIALPGGAKVVMEPIRRKGNRLVLDGFDPCVVLLNNDLSTGAPSILENLEQTVIPPLRAGWATRRKSQHFSAYDNVAGQFAGLIGIDSWLINPFFASCGKINFREKKGEDCVASTVDEILREIQEKYDQYGVKDDPFVIVKADAGTYGMGIMTVKDGSEVRALNRRQRNKMAVLKGGLPVTEVLVQEGVYTFESINEAVAEPVIYMIDHYVVGGFYRIHTSRGIDENLNAAGMQFVPLAFEDTCLLPDRDAKPGSSANRFYSYGVIARLALLAAAQELEKSSERQRAL